jgi:hypothetical protein
MVKKKRQRNSTAYISYEGKREGLILKILDILYQPDQNRISIMPDFISGGNADGIVSRALKNNDRDKVSAWLDEDFEFKSPLSKEIKNQLARCWNIPEKDMEKFYACKLGNLQSSYNEKRRKPCLIVSQPVCVESLILKILGYSLPFEECNLNDCDKQQTRLKNTLDGIRKSENELAFYQRQLTRHLLEEKRESILELDLLIYMHTG